MTSPGWLEETLVWGQVNFNERDPETLDVEWWSQYWAACRLQGVTLNVGGPAAFYPTDVPLHPRSRFLGDGDLLGDTVEAAKKLGLRVLGRLDPSFATPEMRGAHPDWMMTRGDGQPYTWTSLVAAFLGREPAVSVSAADEPYLPCSYSPYFNEYVLEITSEVLQRYDVDGIWTNGWPAGPASPRTMCHCPHCLEAWDRLHPGRARPEQADPSDPSWREYVVFSCSRVEALQRQFRDHVRALRRDAAFISSSATRPETPFRWGRFIDVVDALGVDSQGRPEFVNEPARAPMLWSAGLHSELSRAVAQGKPVIRFIGTYVTDRAVIRQGAKRPGELGLQMALALAHGERPKWHTLGGTSHDRRWMPAARELDDWMARHDEWLHNSTPISDVGVVWSPRSVQLASWVDAPGPSHRDALVGWYAALMEARLPFEYVHEDHLRALGRFKVLVLPSGLCLPEDAVGAIDAFARAGGAVVACCGALSKNEWGESRSAGALFDLLGVRYADELIGPLRHSCIEVTEGTGIAAGLGDTDIIGGATWIVPFDGSGKADGRAEGAWIPDYPVMPTHEVVLPTARQDVPLFSTTIGAGGAPAVYLAPDLDGAYGRHENPDHARVLCNAVVQALADKSLGVEVRGAGVVDVRPWWQRQSRAVFLVNLDNARLQAGVVRELRQIGPFEVVVRLDAGETAQDVRLLRNDITCEWRQSGEAVTAVVPSIDDFELLVVSLTQVPAATCQSAIPNDVL